jgi:hypothetical protein
MQQAALRWMLLLEAVGQCSRKQQLQMEGVWSLQAGYCRGLEHRRTEGSMDSECSDMGQHGSVVHQPCSCATVCATYIVAAAGCILASSSCYQSSLHIGSVLCHHDCSGWLGAVHHAPARDCTP